MGRRAITWTVIGLLAAGAGVSALGAASEMLMLVTVAGDDARAATGLSPADFTISEDKDRLEVLEAMPARDPLSIVLLVDRSVPGGMAATTPEMRRALTGFVGTILAGDTSARIALYQVANAATRLTDFTSDRAVLDGGISQFASGTEAVSNMLEGVITATGLVSDRPAPRRAIVCVSMGTEDGNTSFMPDKVGEQVRKSGATLWVVSVERSSDRPLTNRDAVWKNATADSGGLRQVAVQTSRLDAQLKTVANSLLSQYTLKVVRKKSGAVKTLKGETNSGAQVLFTRWRR